MTRARRSAARTRRPSRWVAGAFVVLGLLAITACDSRGRLLVDVRTDLVPGLEFDTAETTVVGADGPPIRATARLEQDWLAGRRVADVETAGESTVRVRLLRGESALVDRTATLRVRGLSAVTLVMSRACLGRACPDPGGAPTTSACLAGECVETRCNETEAPFCVAQCTASAECAVRADCASGRCLDGLCFAVADHTRCAVGEACHPDLGCLAFPARPDGGPPVEPDAAVPDAARDTGAPDAGCPDSPCRALPTECGCEAGQTCRPLPPVPGCQVAGVGAEGDACSGHPDCGPGLSCLMGPGLTTGSCVRFCTEDAMCGRTCLLGAIGSPTGQCGPACDPVALEGCPPTTSCRVILADLVDGARANVTVCGEPTGDPHGSPCADTRACAPGTFCVESGGRSCRRICRALSDCPGGSAECFFPAPPFEVDGVGLGLCF